MRLLRFSLLLLIGLVALAACSAPCDEQVAAFAASASDITTRYDALMNGESQGSGNLLFDMRALREEAKGLEVPTCGTPELRDATASAGKQLVGYIDATLTAATASNADYDSAVLFMDAMRTSYELAMTALFTALETTE